MTPCATASRSRSAPAPARATCRRASSRSPTSRAASPARSPSSPCATSCTAATSRIGRRSPTPRLSTSTATWPSSPASPLLPSGTISLGDLRVRHRQQIERRLESRQYCDPPGPTADIGPPAQLEVAELRESYLAVAADVGNGRLAGYEE